jgi:hypothetical protein
MMMSENPIRLELLGEMIRRLQADLRTVRDEAKVNQGSVQRQLAMHTEHVQHLLELQTERTMTYEGVTASRIDQLAEIVFAIADKLGVEYRR